MRELKKALLDKQFLKDLSLGEGTKVTDVLTRLEMFKGKNLLVFDNVVERELKQWIAKIPKSSWQILITTRQNTNDRNLNKLDPKEYMPKVVLFKMFTHFFIKGTNSLWSKANKYISHIFGILPKGISKQQLEELIIITEGHVLTIEFIGKILSNNNFKNNITLEEFIDAIKNKTKGNKPDNEPVAETTHSDYKEKNFKDALIATFDLINTKQSLQLINEEKEILKCWTLMPTTTLQADDIAKFAPSVTNIEQILSCLFTKGWLEKERPNLSCWQKLLTIFQTNLTTSKYHLHQMISFALSYQFQYTWTIANSTLEEYKPEFSTVLYNFSESHFAYLLSFFVEHLEKTDLPFLVTYIDELLAGFTEDINYHYAPFLLNTNLRIYKTLAKENPQTYLPFVATTLHKLAKLQHTKNEFPDALAKYEEALQIRRELAKENPRTYLPDVAMTLNNLAVLQKDKNEFPDALGEIRRSLADKKRACQREPKNVFARFSHDVEQFGGFTLC